MATLSYIRLLYAMLCCYIHCILFSFFDKNIFLRHFILRTFFNENLSTAMIFLFILLLVQRTVAVVLYVVHFVYIYFYWHDIVVVVVCRLTFRYTHSMSDDGHGACYFPSICVAVFFRCVSIFLFSFNMAGLCVCVANNSVRRIFIVYIIFSRYIFI